jgi:3'(2'), 5'-bisphosphate nucleotidase
MDPNQLLVEVTALAREAGRAILEVYASSFSVQEKEDRSPLTEADLRSEKLILAGLKRISPEIPVLSEEAAQAPYSTRRNWSRLWVVDPLDGTKEFVQRRGDFTVNVALIENGVPTRGVVYAPAKWRLFFTDAAGHSQEETGAFDRDAVGKLTPLTVGKPDPDALVVVASKSHRDQATDDYIARYSVKDFRSAGSSMKFCLVAAGEADLYPRLGRTMEWDTAAGQAVLLGAGGKVVRFDDHTALVYGKKGYENPFFIAHAPGIDLVAG